MSETIHKFEAAGLGKAPFQFTGVSENLFSIPGCPEATKPGGSCDYCGASIRWEYHILSADGHAHKVGCDCIAKVGDAGLQKQIDPEVRRLRREKAQAKAQAKYRTASLELTALINTLADALRAAPHPSGFTDRQTGAPLTAFDWARWMADHCGTSGKEAIVRRLKKEFSK